MALLKYKNQNGEYVSLPVYTVNSPQVVLDTGDSTTAVMSQNAVTLVVLNLPDNEDLTIEEDKLKLADRAYNPEEFSGKGYKILRKNIVEGKNILTLDMINEPNTVYEIRYDYDLNQSEIVIPEGCTLKFDGGSFSNFNKLTGNKTIIIANETKIFSYDRTKQYIDGVWSIKEWNAAWFGLINDGFCDIAESSENTYIFSGTDNYDGIQKSLDTAYIAYPKSCYIPSGRYRICKGLNIGWGTYTNIKLRGNNRSLYPETNFDATFLFCEGEYGISINAGRGISIKDISIIGLNFTYLKFHGTSETYGDKAEGMYDIINWSNAILKNRYRDNGLSRYCPYGGIISDGYTLPSDLTSIDNGYSEPEFPAFFKRTSMYSIAASSRTKLDNLFIAGFGVGIGHSVGPYDDNDDFNGLTNSVITGNIIGFSTCNSQSRQTLIQDCSINGYYALDSFLFGSQKGHYGGAIINVDFGDTFHMCHFAIGYISPIKFLNCYAEMCYDLGEIDNAGSVSSSCTPITFDSCEFKLHSPGKILLKEYGLQNIILKGIANFVNTSIRTSAGLSLFMPTNTTISNYVLGSDFKCVDNMTISFIKQLPFLLCPFKYLHDSLVHESSNIMFISNLFTKTNVETQRCIRTDALLYQYIRPTNGTLLDYNNVDNTAIIPYNATNTPYKDKEDSIGDFIISDNFSGIITSVEDTGYKIKLINGYKYDVDTNLYSAINMTYTIISGISNKQRSIDINIVITEILADNKIKINKWVDDIFIVGRILDFYGSYTGCPLFINTQAYISSIDKEAMTITFNRGIAASVGHAIRGYFIMHTDEKFNDTLNWYKCYGES